VSSWWGVAESQERVITVAQMADAGVSRAGVNRLLRDGTLQRAARGVLVAGAAEPEGMPFRRRLWLAVLQAGPSAVAYRRSAAAWWGLDGNPGDVVEVALPWSRQSRTTAVHRLIGLEPEHVTRHLGLPITTVARTLVDLGSAVPSTVVERALEGALRQRMVSIDDLVDLTARARSWGRGALAEVMAARPAGTPATGSDAETQFLQLARAAGLPEPRRQFVLVLAGRQYRMDFAWPSLRLAVEIDGFQVHGQPSALRADLRRQNRIVLDGWMILRFTWADVVRQPELTVIRDLRAAFALGGGGEGVGGRGGGPSRGQRGGRSGSRP